MTVNILGVFIYKKAGVGLSLQTFKLIFILNNVPIKY